MSRFPKITETFILYEMLAIERLGFDVALYPIWRARAAVIHPEALGWLERANFRCSLSLVVLRANWQVLRQQPRNYVDTLRATFRGTWGSLRFFCGALAVFPKAVCFASEMKAGGIVHVHAHFASHPALVAFIIHRLVGISYSFTAHGSDLHRDRRMLGQKIGEAAFTVTISEYNRHVMAAECAAEDRHKLQVIHCGVDTQLFRPSSFGSAGARETSPLSIFCVGTLHEVKGQTHLIRACRLLSGHGIDVVLNFIGDGPDRQALRRQAVEAGMADRVVFHGEKTHAQVADLLRAADVVAAPSVPTRTGRREGIPVVLMEAMSTGIPVVASRLSGIPELVEHERTGLLVPPRDAQALANAFRRLHADPSLRHRLGQAGRFKIMREFDLFTNSAALAELFEMEDRATRGARAPAGPSAVESAS